MTTQRDHNVSRRGPWKPPVIDLTVPVASFTRILCTVRKKPAVAQPDDTDTDVVGQISLGANAHGVIGQVGLDALQLFFKNTVVRTWTEGEYVYDVQGVLAADSEPYTLVKGRLTMGWSATQSP
jgi:hypothetical protein